MCDIMLYARARGVSEAVPCGVGSDASVVRTALLFMAPWDCLLQWELQWTKNFPSCKEFGIVIHRSLCVDRMRVSPAYVTGRCRMSLRAAYGCRGATRSVVLCN